MENKRRFFHGRFIKVDIDKILSIHENIYNQEPSFFLYMAGINEKVVLCEDDYDELCDILYNITYDIENIVATEDNEYNEDNEDNEDNDNSNVPSNVSKLNMF